jgi:hypothetical protein
VDITRIVAIAKVMLLKIFFALILTVRVLFGCDIGICIPINNANEETWTQWKQILKKLKSTFNCAVYDLHGGQKLELFNIDTFKKDLPVKSQALLLTLLSYVKRFL